MSNLTKKEKYIKTFFYPKSMDEDEAESVVRQISKIGSDHGFVGNEGEDDRRKHKYDVWIAKQVKEDLLILERDREIHLILDWFISENINAMSYDFHQAMEGQANWHQELIDNASNELIPLPKDIDEKRVIFRCSDREHFFYLLSEDELAYEGRLMKNCVGADHYKKNVKNERALIVSLRDQKNEPHLTIEIGIDKKPKIKGTLHQQYGKANSTPAEKYWKCIVEFTLFSSKCIDDETLEELNKSFTK